MSKKTPHAADGGTISSEAAKPICGIVMPISKIETCDESHWLEVREIIEDCIERAGFKPNMVSEAQEVGVIHKRILQNLYENPMVVCDISCRNANVMLELGIRLTFDKPTIIIKDDKTPSPFDTTPIEYLSYPRDLRFKAVETFKETLIAKIRSTHEVAISDKNYSTFLKHFGDFKVPTISTVKASPQEVVLENILNELGLLKSIVSTDRKSSTSTTSRFRPRNAKVEVCLATVKPDAPEVIALINAIQDYHQSARPTAHQYGDHFHLVIDLGTSLPQESAAGQGYLIATEMDKVGMREPANEGCTRILVTPS